VWPASYRRHRYLPKDGLARRALERRDEDTPERKWQIERSTPALSQQSTDIGSGVEVCLL
jgi:hypothetical protein